MATQKLYIIWTVLLVLGIPFVFKLVPPNAVLGVRFGSTSNNPRVWEKVNSFAGWCIILLSAFGIAATIFRPDIAEQWGQLMVAGCVFTVVVATFIYMKIVA